jgi:hypothetical protein
MIQAMTAVVVAAAGERCADRVVASSFSIRRPRRWIGATDCCRRGWLRRTARQREQVQMEKTVLYGARGEGCEENYGEYLIQLEDYLSLVLEYQMERFKNYCEYCETCMHARSALNTTPVPHTKPFVKRR